VRGVVALRSRPACWPPFAVVFHHAAVHEFSNLPHHPMAAIAPKTQASVPDVLSGRRPFVRWEKFLELLLKIIEVRSLAATRTTGTSRDRRQASGDALLDRRHVVGNAVEAATETWEPITACRAARAILFEGVRELLGLYQTYIHHTRTNMFWDFI